MIQGKAEMSALPNFAACPGLAAAANVSFNWPHRSDTESDKGQLWAGSDMT